MGLHACADEGHLADLVVVGDVVPAFLRLEGLEQLHGAGAVGDWEGEGDVGGQVVEGGDVLQHHVDVDLVVGEGTEHLGCFPWQVLDAEDGDFRFGGVGGNAGQYCFFHGDILQCSGDEGAGIVAV